LKKKKQTRLFKEIFKALKESRQLRKHHLYLLISVYSRALDFSGCEADLSLMLQLGRAGRGSNIEDLSGFFGRQ